MKSVNSLFVRYAPIFFLLPFSIVIGLYVLGNLDLLLLPENLPYFYIYMLYILAPLYFVIFRPRQDMGHELLEIGRKLFSRFYQHKWIYSLMLVSFSIFFLYIASIHISTYLERDRWILVGDMSVVPVDMVFLPRFAYVLNWFVPIDISVPLANLPFILLWFLFLIYANGDNPAWVPVVLTFISTLATHILFITLYATFEFPAAIVSFIGLYGLWRKKLNTGILFLILGSVLKNTGLFHFASGGILIVLCCWQEKTIKGIFERFDIKLLFFLAGYWVLNYWGLYYQIFELNGGLGYLVQPRHEEVFLISPLLAFITGLLDEFTLVFVLGIAGAILSKENRLFFYIAIVLLIIVRSLSRWADSVYAQIFIPGFSYFTLLCIIYLWKWMKVHWVKVSFALLLLGINIFEIYVLSDNFSTGMNRFNSNFDEFVGKLARRFPEDGGIYERGITILPYLREQRGGDLDAIEFRYLVGERNEVIFELSQPGCKLIVTQKDFLDERAITEADLVSMGYSESPYILEDRSGNFVSYSKGCNGLGI